MPDLQPQADDDEDGGDGRGGERTAWLIAAKGHHFDLAQLVHLTAGEPIHLAMRRDGDDGAEVFYLELPIGLAGTDHEDVRQKAQQAMRVLNGLGSLQVPGFRRVELDSNMHVIDASGARRDVVIQGMSVSARMQGFAPTVVVGGVVRSAASTRSAAAGFMRAAAESSDVCNALEIVGKLEPTWSQLFVAFEIVHADARGALFAWVSEAKVKLFKRTAGSYAVLGAESRHGPEPIDPPDNPMPYPDALALIRTLVNAWITKRIARFT